MSFLEKIKKQLNPTIPADYELEFDICMKCGRRLSDKKYTTWKTHQNDLHRPTRKEAAYGFFFKHPILSVLVLVVAVMGVVIFGPFSEWLAEGILFLIMVNTPEEEKQYFLSDQEFEKCKDDSLALKQLIYTQKEFTPADTNEFNRLLDDCNVDWFSYQLSKPVFLDESYATEKP